MDQLAQKAIEEALKGNWKEAASLNEEIIKDETNIEQNSISYKEALNRLARAYLELGKIPKAQATYKKVLKLDPYNSIAGKAIERLKNLKINPLKKKNGISHSSTPITANLFIEEPGKTKSVTLIHLGAAQVVISLDAGQLVKLETHAHRVSVMTEEDEYIGRLPDDISRRIIKFTSAGNKYASYIRSVAPDCVRIFIKELERSLALKDTPSFPSLERSSYVAFTSPDSIHDEPPDVSTMEEESSEQLE